VAAEILLRHLTPAEIARAWALDESTVRRMFHDAPGVLKLGRTIAARGKRSYTTLRIPREVAERVYQERTK
jgi:hypothetical protein